MTASRGCSCGLWCDRHWDEKRSLPDTTEVGPTLIMGAELVAEVGIDFQVEIDEENCIWFTSLDWGDKIGISPEYFKEAKAALQKAIDVIDKRT